MSVRMTHLLRPLEQQPALAPRKIDPKTGFAGLRSLVAKTKSKIKEIRTQVPSTQALNEQYPHKNKGDCMKAHIDKVRGDFPLNVQRLDAFEQPNEQTYQDKANDIPASTTVHATTPEQQNDNAYQYHADSLPAPGVRNQDEILRLITPSRRSKQSKYCPRYTLPRSTSKHVPYHPGLFRRIGNVRENRAIRKQRKAEQRQEIRGSTYGYVPLDSSGVLFFQDSQPETEISAASVRAGLTFHDKVDVRAHVELMLMLRGEAWDEEEVSAVAESEVSGPCGF